MKRKNGLFEFLLRILEFSGFDNKLLLQLIISIFCLIISGIAIAIGNVHLAFIIILIYLPLSWRPVIKLRRGIHRLIQELLDSSDI